METRIPLVGQRLRSAVLMATLLLTLTLTLLGTTVSAQPSAESLNESVRSSDFEAAQLNYERNHWPQAYAAFAALADRGHGDAARIALQMARHGPALYGSSFSASDGQRKRWAALAACAGELAIAECTGPPLRSPAHNFPRAPFVRPAFPTPSIGTDLHLTCSSCHYLPAYVRSAKSLRNRRSTAERWVWGSSTSAR